MAKKRNPEVIDLEKRKKHLKKREKIRHANIGAIMFFLIFLYMAFYVYTYITREKVQFYEVAEGSIMEDRKYTGLILREESVFTTDSAGYINYFIREGKRASVGASVYSLDESGRMEQFLEENSGGSAQISADDLASLKKEMTSFSLSYDDDNFSQVEDMKYSLEAAMMEYVSFNAMDSLTEAMEQAGINFHQIRADKAGVVSYVVDQYTDGDGQTHAYAGMKPADVTADAFNRAGYSRTQAKSGDLVEQGASIYKIITSDQWSLVFPMDQQDVSDYSGQNQLHVTFPGYDLELTGNFSVIAGADGNTHVSPGKGGGVVDAVSHHGNPMPFFLQRADAGFLLRGKHVGNGLFDSELLLDGCGRQPVIPCQHHHMDAHFAEGANGGSAGLPNRIGHRDDAFYFSFAGEEKRGFSLGGEPVGLFADLCIFG